MRILFVADHYLPAVNGVVMHMLLVKSELERRGHTVLVVAPSYNPRKEKHDAKQLLYRLPSVSNPFRKLDRILLPYSRSVEKQLLSTEIDIVHSHLFLSGYLGLRVAKKKRIPAVVTLHTLFRYYPQWMFHGIGTMADPLMDFVQRVYFDKFDMVIAPSEKAIDALKLAGVQAPAKVVHNGINLRPFLHPNASLFRRKFRIPKHMELLVLVGRIDPGKHVDIAVSAMQEVLRVEPNIMLAIVGDGLLRGDIEKQIKTMGLSDRVFITGFVDTKMVASANKAATFALFPSTEDTFSTVAMEIIACGTPIIASRDKAVAGIVRNGHNGILVQPHVEAFSKAILTLLKKRQQVARFRKAALRDRSQFSIQRSVDHLLALYREVIVAKKKKLSR